MGLGHPPVRRRPFTLSAKLLQGRKWVTSHPGLPGPGVPWGPGLSELTQDSPAEQDKLVTLPPEARGVYATLSGARHSP